MTSNIQAKIIADSISENDNRITTVQVKFHRYILAEFNTHRKFSRNFSSSRAIPTSKLLEQVITNPALPVYWGKNKSGMQAIEEISISDQEKATMYLQSAAIDAANVAKKLSDMGVHKQIVNRVLEPYLFVEGIVTSTEWNNFFELRCHKDAQPEIQEVANKIKIAINNSTPIKLNNDQWHLPYIKDEDYKLITEYPDIKFILQKISAARCCRVSYLLHDGTNPNVTDDLSLFNRLAGSVPKHHSLLEHQALPDEFDDFIVAGRVYHNPEYHGNFDGFIQFRKLSEYNLV